MLEIAGLTRHYGSVTAQDGASLTARAGRLLGFLGPNGAGKTTAVRCVFEAGGRVSSGAVLASGGRMRIRDAWRARR